MKRYIQQTYSSIAEGIEMYEEPYRTRALRELKAGFAAVIVGGATSVSAMAANVALGFFENQEAAQETLAQVQAVGFGVVAVAGLATVFGLGRAEQQNQQAQNPQNN